MKPSRALALFILIGGGAAVCFLTFGVAVSFLFSLFGSPSRLSQVLGYGSLTGPIPLLAGAVLLLFRRAQRQGARLVLAGSFVLSFYMVVCYTRLNIYSVRIPERLLWFGLIPLVVLAVNYASYRLYKLVQQDDSSRESRPQGRSIFLKAE